LTTALAVVAVVIMLLAVWVVPAVITGLKGKTRFLLGGFFVHLLWYVGAIRLAKPSSWRANRFYDEAKMARARAHDGIQPAYVGEWRKCPECEASVRLIDRTCHICGHTFANTAVPLTA
jgi:hypothetical protein